MFHQFRVRFVAAMFLTLALLVPAIGTAAAAPSFEQVIVVLHDNVSQPDAVASELSRRHNGQVGFVYQHALKGFSIELPARAVAAIARDSRVDYVEPDQVAWAFGEVPTGVDRIEADKNGTAQIDGVDQRVDVDIAIIDTGVASHADLNIFRTIDCTQGNPVRTTCGTGGADGNGHGTHVAGTAAALDNGSGVVGVAPGARIWGVKVLGDDGSGRISWIVAGIDYVTGNASAIEAANMSLGCECSSAAMDDAITRSTNAGVVYVVAAGNNAKDAATFSPANHPQVIAVSAVTDFNGKAGGGASPTCRTDVDDTLADFSNFGSVVDLAAPGVCITSTWLSGGYATISGTSMASPHGAGAAALYIVEKGIAKSSARWSTVRGGLQSEWAVSQSGACGFTGGLSGEPMLMLAACDSADPGDPVENVAPAASFTFTCADLSCGFNGSASSDSDGTIERYAWNFGDGSATGSGGMPNHTYTTAGTYTVTLTVTDNDGATGSVSQTVTVSAPSSSTTMHVGALTGSSVSSGSSWTASATTTIRDTGGNPVQNATMSWTWSNGTSGSGTCVTNSNGQCTVSKTGIPKRTSSVTFTVTDVDHASLTYDSSANSATSVTVTKP